MNTLTFPNLATGQAEVKAQGHDLFLWENQTLLMSPTPSSSRIPRRNAGLKGFSLVEILVVISVMSILSLLVTTGFQSVMGTTYSNQASEIATTLIRARAYAMANNTYVFVGIQEVDAAQPVTGAQTAGSGRIAVSVVASNDGTRIYSPSAPAALDASRLAVVLPLRHYDNIHIYAPATATPAISTLPNATSGTTYNLALPSSTTSSTLQTSSKAATTYNWPLTGGVQYSFGNNSSSPGTVIQFNPQGEAQIVTAANTDAILQWIEIDLAPSRGNKVSSTTVNPATILIDGASGSVSLYRS